MAAMAGANTEPATALMAWVKVTNAPLLIQGSTRQLPVTSSAAMAITARLAVVLSINAPAGVWVSNAVTLAKVMTRPMLPGSQWCTASR